MARSIQPDERAVELQAGAHSARKVIASLLRYDAVENERHLLMRLFEDGAEQERLEQALIEGDQWEAAQLRKVLRAAEAFEVHAHLLAGAITELLEARSAPASTARSTADDARAVGASA